MKNKSLLLTLFFLLSCGEPPEKFELDNISKGSEESIDSKINYFSNSSKFQKVEAKEGSVIFSPGTLVLNAEIIIAKGNDDLSDQYFEKVNESVSITAKIDGDVTIYQPMNISLPLPVNIKNINTGSLAIAYNSYLNEKGVISSSDLRVSNGNVSFQASYWGQYQIVMVK